jgi:polyketide biosynthesis enoyl-CoA hydratase PksH
MTLVDHAVHHVRVTLDQPERRNTIDDAFLADLDRALTGAEAATDCRVFVLAAVGADFCAGMALDTSYSDGAADEGTLPYWQLLSRFTTTDLVTVALVDGAVSAGGVGLVAACDVVLAGGAASFRFTEALFGMLPAMALPFVARRIGAQRAFTAALLTERYGPQEATAMGLVDRCGPSAERLLRPLLIGCRRVDRRTVGALKDYRRQLYPPPAHHPATAFRAFHERLAAPGVRDTMARLKRELGGWHG